MSKNFDSFIEFADSTIKLVGDKENEPNISQVEIDRYKDSLKNEILNKFTYVSKSAISRIFQISDLAGTTEVVKYILENEIYFSGVIQNINSLPEMLNQSVIIRIGKREAFLTRDKLLDMSNAYASFWSALNSRTLTDSINVEDCYELGRHFIVPNLTVNMEEIEIRKQTASDEISPIREIVEAGDVIIRAGNKTTERQAEILAELYRQEKSESADESSFKHYLPVLARFILVLVAFIFLYVYFYNFHYQIYASNPKLLALFFIYGLELLFIYVVGIRLSLSLYLYPIAIFSILITVLFDAEIGTINTFVLALLLGILHRFNFSIVLVTIIAGFIACYSIQNVRQRSEFFKPVIYTSISYVALVLVLESFKITPSESILNLMGYGVVNAIFSPLLAMGILPVFESLFGFTTNVTLLELSDLNRPLLKRLSMEAPGTYHHSLLVGNLAEAAAKSINANPLLARVGAYYHDIGKMEIPEYFVENQLGIKSKHESLTPTMSSIILASHLKKGRIIGEYADLPDEVLNFIEEHHGTMTMAYFYNKAKEQGDENLSDDEFKYPGPKPQIRETAIVMLADSVEAASRTLTEPKPARIRHLVQNIINDRFQSGELEECPLTLKDLAEIRESFVQILIGVFHHRIEYPDKDEKE